MNLVARALLRFLLAGAVCFVLSGCFSNTAADGHVKKITVHDDGQATVKRVSAARKDAIRASLSGLELISNEREMRQITELFCLDVIAGLESASEQNLAYPNQRVSSYRSDGLCGAAVTTELRQSSNHSADASALTRSTTELFEVRGGWSFEAAVIENTPDNDAYDRIEPATRVVVELPGQPIEGEHNADSVEGGTFVWEIDPQSPRSRLFATTEPATGLNRLPISPKVLVVLLGNLLLIGGVGGYFLRTDRPTQWATPPEPAANAGTNGVPGAAATAAPGTPYFDETYGIWMLQDPSRGLLWHREGTDEWVPF